MDDQSDNQASLRGYSAYFNIYSIEGYGDACERVAALSAASDRRSLVDLFLLDLSMDERVTDHRGLDWGSRTQNIVPYGPVLALPFLAVRPLTQFVPYSRFWLEPEVTRNGYVMLSLSLLLSAIRQQPVTMKAAQAEIKRRLCKAKLPREALASGLKMFRRRLEKSIRSGSIRLHCVRQLQDDLMEIVRRRRTVVPLTSLDGARALTIDWTYEDGETERIEVGSLFADVLKFEDAPTPARVERVAAMLDVWKLLAHPSSAPSDEQLFVAAKEVLHEVATLPQTQKDLLIRLVDQHPYVTGLNGDPYLLRRTVLLFVWVYAWHERLFASGSDLMVRVKDILFHPDDESLAKLNLTSFDKRYVRYLGDDDMVAYDHNRTPFSACAPSHKSFVRNSYCLLENKPGYLLRRDMSLCRRFAIEHLHLFRAGLPQHDGEERGRGQWVGEKARNGPYPRWMTESDITEMVRGLQKTASTQAPSELATPARGAGT